MSKIEKIRKALARMTLKTPDTMLKLMIHGSLAKQNSNPQEAKEVAERMLNATRNSRGEVEIRYTLLCIGNVGKFLLSNTKDGYIRYLTKRNDSHEIKDLQQSMAAHEQAKDSSDQGNTNLPVLVRITMSKAVFLGLYHNMVDAQTAWYHGEITTEGENWLFHSIVLLNTFEIFRKTLGLPVPEEMTPDTEGGKDGEERDNVALV